MAGPIVNGRAYDWGSIDVKMFGRNVISLRGISFTPSQDKANEYGRGYKPVERGHGNIEYEGSVTVTAKEYHQILKAAQKQGFPSLLAIPPFEITVIVGQAGQDPMKKQLTYCEFNEEPFDASQGDTNIEVELGITPGDILNIP
jgi:hypothetical protein